MNDTTYQITTSEGTLIAQYNTDGPNNWTRGETATFTFEFPVLQDSLTVTDGYTASGVESYVSITVESGATLTIPSGSTVIAGEANIQGEVTGEGVLSIQDAPGVFNDFAEWAGSYTTQEMLNSTVKYRMQLPDEEPIDSLLWGIEPSGDLQDENVVGVWGLVESINNRRNQALTINRYQVDVTVVATFDDYTSAGAVTSELVI